MPYETPQSQNIETTNYIRNPEEMNVVLLYFTDALKFIRIIDEAKEEWYKAGRGKEVGSGEFRKNVLNKRDGKVQIPPNHYSVLSKIIGRVLSKGNKKNSADKKLDRIIKNAERGAKKLEQKEIEHSGFDEEEYQDFLNN